MNANLKLKAFTALEIPWMMLKSKESLDAMSQALHQTIRLKLGFEQVRTEMPDVFHAVAHLFAATPNLEVLELSTSCVWDFVLQDRGAGMLLDCIMEADTFWPRLRSLHLIGLATPK